MHAKLITISTAVLLLIVLSVPNAVAADDDWEHNLTFYGWLAGIDGTVGVGTLDLQVDFRISDAFDARDKVKRLFMLHYEGVRGPWTLLADYSNLELEGGSNTLAGPATLSLGQSFAELSGTYRVSGNEADPCDRDVAVLLGLRYADISSSFQLPAGASTGFGEDWIDPIVGLTYRTPLGERWNFGARGDIGGFGIGDSSDLVWNLLLRFSYSDSKRWAFSGGWRWLDYDYDTGADASRFVYDVTMQGPFVGANYDF